MSDAVIVQCVDHQATQAPAEILEALQALAAENAKLHMDPKWVWPCWRSHSRERKTCLCVERLKHNQVAARGSSRRSTNCGPRMTSFVHSPVKLSQKGYLKQRNRTEVAKTTSSEPRRLREVPGSNPSLAARSQGCHCRSLQTSFLMHDQLLTGRACSCKDNQLCIQLSFPRLQKAHGGRQISWQRHSRKTFRAEHTFAEFQLRGQCLRV